MDKHANFEQIFFFLESNLSTFCRSNGSFSNNNGGWKRLEKLEVWRRFDAEINKLSQIKN